MKGKLVITLDGRFVVIIDGQYSSEEVEAATRELRATLLASGIELELLTGPFQSSPPKADSLPPA